MSDCGAMLAHDQNTPFRRDVEPAQPQIPDLDTAEFFPNS
jgi:hypothetical protein